MCTGQSPATVLEAVAALRASLAFLNQVPAAELPGAVQADCLRELAKAESAYTAAHARMLGAFAASGAHEDDGQQSERAWLRWQTQITKGAAAGAVGWMKRLAAHPAVRSALADGAISPSWARHICTWTDSLPEDGRDDADQILLAAAADGAVLPDLAALAETSLTNLVLLCAFHHLIAVHQWGWTLTLHADGTTTTTSPDRTRTLHSHGPPSRAA